MKHKLILMLKTLFASKGFSQKTLEGLADILVPNLTEESTDDEIKTAVTGIEPYANLMQSEVTRVANEVANKPKSVEANKPVVTPVELKPDEDMPAWAKALVTSTQALALGFEAIKGEKLINTRKEQLAKILENTPDAFKNKALKDFNRMKFETDEEFNDYLTDTQTDAADFIQDQSNTGLGGDAPARGLAGKPAAEKEVSAEMKQYQADRMAERVKPTV